MKRYCKRFKFTEKDVINSITDCLSRTDDGVSRWDKTSTAYFLAEYAIKMKLIKAENKHHGKNIIRKLIENDFDKITREFLPVIARKIIEEIESRAIEFEPIKIRTRIDASSGKIREIGISSMKQQIFDYIIINAMMAMLVAKIGVYQCSSIKGRGQIYAKKAAEKFIRKKYMHCRYIVKGDIRKYYPSVNHDKLLQMLRRDIKSKDVVYIAECLLRTYSGNGVGLCIGTYFSQYMGNYYLSEIYHRVYEELRIERKTKDGTKMVKPVYKAIFYADDFVLFGANKKYLKIAMKWFKEKLQYDYGLEIKHGQYELTDMSADKAFIDFVGFRIYKERTDIRRRVFRRICKTMRRLRRHIGNKLYNSRVLTSYHGFVKYSDVGRFRKRSGYDKIFKYAKGAIGRYAKNCNDTEAA